MSFLGRRAEREKARGWARTTISAVALPVELPSHRPSVAKASCQVTPLGSAGGCHLPFFKQPSKHFSQFMARAIIAEANTGTVKVRRAEVRRAEARRAEVRRAEVRRAEVRRAEVRRAEVRRAEV